MSITNINPLLSEFLDCKSVAQKMRVLNKYRNEWDVELLTVIETSLETVPADSDDVHEHYSNVKKILEMKKKYEEPGIM